MITSHNIIPILSYLEMKQSKTYQSNENIFYDEFARNFSLFLVIVCLSASLFEYLFPEEDSP